MCSCSHCWVQPGSSACYRWAASNLYSTTTSSQRQTHCKASSSLYSTACVTLRWTILLMLQLHRPFRNRAVSGRFYFAPSVGGVARADFSRTLIDHRHSSSEWVKQLANPDYGWADLFTKNFMLYLPWIIRLREYVYRKWCALVNFAPLGSRRRETSKYIRSCLQDKGLVVFTLEQYRESSVLLHAGLLLLFRFKRDTSWRHNERRRRIASFFYLTTVGRWCHPLVTIIFLQQKFSGMRIY